MKNEFSRLKSAVIPLTVVEHRALSVRKAELGLTWHGLLMSVLNDKDVSVPDVPEPKKENVVPVVDYGSVPIGDVARSKPGQFTDSVNVGSGDSGSDDEFIDGDDDN